MSTATAPGRTSRPGGSDDDGREQGANRRVPPTGWRACVPELIIAAILIAASTVAVYFYAGLPAAEIIVTVWAVTALVLLRLLVPPPTATAPDEEQDRRGGRGSTSFIGFWRKRGLLVDASASMASYDAQLRVTLQHLLAARLAERHGISLYADPAAARRALLTSPGESDLWFWLDPERPAVTEQGRRGIPPRTLAAIIDRLERL